jgi:NAD(P)-dependent dehydrogenase (short-subunit alcohol dehydrogenase family)
MLTVVTGSASGIGAATRKRLEKSGDTVIGIDLRDAEIIADLATKEGRNAAIAGVKKKCSDHIDRFVASAGVIGTSAEDISSIIAVDYFGVVELLDGLFGLLRKGNNPAAVVIASNSASQLQLDPEYQQHPLTLAILDNNEYEAIRVANALSDPTIFVGMPQPRGGIVYMAAKNAVVRAVRQRAMPWGQAGVRLNVVAPGPTSTPMLQRMLEDPKTRDSVKALPIPMSRYGKPEEQAAAVAFLLSTESSYIHGIVVFVDGGVDAMIRSDSF